MPFWKGDRLIGELGQSSAPDGFVNLIVNFGRIQNLALVVGGRIFGFFDDDPVIPRDLVVF